MGIPLSTNGLVPPPDFPVSPYEGVHCVVMSHWPTHEHYEHYAGAWNGVAYRFQAAIEAGDQFAISLKTYGSSPTADERYRQDQALAEFFNSGFSVFESTFYGLHVLATFISPSNFSLDTPKARQQISPSNVTAACKRNFPSDPILSDLDNFFSSAVYQEWREIRNVLTHRTAPGRRMYVGIGIDDAPETEWKLNNIPLDGTVIPSRRAGLATTLNDLLGAIEQFVIRRV